MAEMESLALRMQQEARVHWRYERPLKRIAKWHVQKVCTYTGCNGGRQIHTQDVEEEAAYNWKRP